jgi:ABC-type spermidine/putrescine transport system permease subunit II
VECLAFALSFDEVIVTTFTAGQQTTLTDMDVFRISQAKTKANNKCSSSFYNVYNFYTYSLLQAMLRAKHLNLKDQQNK